MDNLKIFEKEEFGSVRTIVVNGEPMFVASDVAKALGYEDPNKAIVMHCKSGDKPKWQFTTLTHSNGVGSTQAKIIGEGEVFKLILRSHLPTAEKFQDWICEEVLPSIRKTGGYIVSKPEDTNEEILARAFLVAMDTIKRKDEEIKQLNVKTTQLTEKTIKDAPKVEFFNQVTDSKDAIDMASCAKVLHFGIGRNSLFQILRNEGILTSNNQPYQQYIDRGWFRVIEQRFEKENGDICVYLKTVVYQKGVDGIRRILTDQNIIEK